MMTGNLEISKTTPIITFRGTGGSGAITRLNLSTYDFTINEPSCSIITADDENFSSSFDIRLKTPGALANSQSTALFIKSNRYVGIGINDPSRKLQIRGANPTFVRFETWTNAENETTGIELAIPGYTSGSCAKIQFTTSLNFTNNLQFLTSFPFFLVSCQHMNM